MPSEENTPQAHVSLFSLDAYRNFGKSTWIANVHGNLRQKIFGSDWAKPQSLVTSYFTSPLAVLIFRIVAAIYCFIVLVVDLSLYYDGGFWWAYLTHWSFLVMFLYLLAAIHLSVRYRRTVDKTEYKRDATAYELFVNATYTTQYAFHLLIPFVYWSEAYVSNRWSRFNGYPAAKQFTDFSMHAITVIIMGAEMYCNKVIFCWGHLVIMLVQIISFVIFAQVAGENAFAGKGPYNSGYAYEFMELNTAKHYGEVIIIIIACAGSWLISYAMHAVRQNIGHAVMKNQEGGKQQMQQQPPTEEIMKSSDV